ncbi:hypothetical protein ABK040_007150 [Willaertia magna]
MSTLKIDLQNKLKEYESSLNKDSLTLMKNIMLNIVKNPTNDLYKKIKLSNQKLQDKIIKVNGSIEYLKIVGFNLDNEYLYLMNDFPLQKLQIGISVIDDYLNPNTTPSSSTGNETQDYYGRKDDGLELAMNMANLLNANEDLKRNPNNPITILKFVKCLKETKTQESYLKAKGIINNLLKQSQLSNFILFKSYNELASINYNLGLLSESLNNIQQASIYYHSLFMLSNTQFSNNEVLIDEDKWDYHLLNGCILVGNKQYNEAVKEFDLALQNLPKDWNPLHTIRQRCNALCMVYLENYIKQPTQQVFNNSINGLKEIINHTCVNHEQSLLNISIIYMKQQDLKNAIYYLEILKNRPLINKDGIKECIKAGSDLLEIIKQKL